MNLIEEVARIHGYVAIPERIAPCRIPETPPETLVSRVRTRPVP